MDPFICKYCGQNFGEYKFEGAAMLKVHYLSKHVLEVYNKKEPEMEHSQQPKAVQMILEGHTPERKPGDTDTRKRDETRKPDPSREDAEKSESNGEDASIASRKRSLPQLYSDSIAPAVKFKHTRIVHQGGISEPVLKMQEWGIEILSVKGRRKRDKRNRLQTMPRLGTAISNLATTQIDDVTLVDEVTKEDGGDKTVMVKEKDEAANLTHQSKNGKTNDNLGTVCSRLLSLIPPEPIWLSVAVSDYGTRYNDTKFYTRFGHATALNFLRAHLSDKITFLGNQCGMKVSLKQKREEKEVSVRKEIESPTPGRKAVMDEVMKYIDLCRERFKVEQLS